MSLALDACNFPWHDFLPSTLAGIINFLDPGVKEQDKTSLFQLVPKLLCSICRHIPNVWEQRIGFQNTCVKILNKLCFLSHGDTDVDKKYIRSAFVTIN